MARGLTFSHAAKSSTVKISEWKGCDCNDGAGVGACAFCILSSFNFTGAPQRWGVERLPTCRHGCQNVGAGFGSIPVWLPTILGFSVGSLGAASGILRASLLCSSAGAPDADRHDLDYPLPVLHGRHRLQTDDRLQGRSVRLPRLSPHGAPRRARVQMHVPHMLEDDLPGASGLSINSGML